MRCLVIFPPQWIPFNPHLAPASIQGILRNSGHDVSFRDLNTEFYNTVLTPNFLLGSLERAFKIYNDSAQKISSIRQQKRELKEFPQDFQRIFIRFREIEKIAKQNEYNVIAQNLPKAIEIIRDKNNFYNPYLLDRAFKVADKATDILSSVFYPSRVNFLNVVAQSYYTVEEMKFNCSDREGNIFYHFYEFILPALLKTDFDYIGISLGDYTQLIPGLTLAMLLKKHTKSHINIGGNLFGRYTDVLINNPEFFNTFADSIIYNEGEKPVLELMKYLEGTIPINEVPNLIYPFENKVKINEETSPLKISELPAPDYTDFPAQSYYTPEVIYNIQASRNCYWQKCAFCTHHFGSKYAVKPVEQIVNEIKELQNRYNAKYFHFVDEAISPAYLRKLSEKIIEDGVDINFYAYGRLEKEFTPDLFKLARQAGLRFILWGFEAANKRVYKLMNKGELCSPVERQKIIQSAFDADIWNHLFIMFGFPSENLDEAKETVHFLRENRNITSHSTGGRFVLLENAPILKDLKKYTITKVQKVRSGFSFAHRFEAYRGMKNQDFEELENYKTEYWELPKLKYRDSSYREKVFLYVCRYGTRNISKMRDKIWL